MAEHRIRDRVRDVGSEEKKGTTQPKDPFKYEKNLRGLSARTLSKEHKEILIKFNIGNKYCLGRKLSEKTKRKMGEANKGNKYWLGKHHTEESKKKISAIHKGNKYCLGRKMSIETRNKIRTKLKGNNSPMWEGGISFEPYGLAWTEQLKESIRERDNYVCQLCKKHRIQFKQALHVHHIDYIKTNIFTFNLISLCNSCHGLTSHNKEYWKILFQQYLKEKYGYVYYNEQQQILIQQNNNLEVKNG